LSRTRRFGFTGAYGDTIGRSSIGWHGRYYLYLIFVFGKPLGLKTSLETMSRLYFDGFVFTFRALGYAYESNIANSEAAGYVVDQRKTQALVGLVTGRYEHSAAAMTIRRNVNSFVSREGLDEFFISAE